MAPTTWTGVVEGPGNADVSLAADFWPNFRAYGLENSILSNLTPLLLYLPQQNPRGLAGDGSSDLDRPEWLPTAPKMDGNVSPASDFWLNIRLCGRENYVIAHRTLLLAQSSTAEFERACRRWLW